VQVDVLYGGLDDFLVEVGKVRVLSSEFEHSLHFFKFEGAFADAFVLFQQFVHADGVGAEFDDVAQVIGREVAFELQQQGLHVGVNGDVYVLLGFGTAAALLAFGEVVDAADDVIFGLTLESVILIADVEHLADKAARGIAQEGIGLAGFEAKGFDDLTVPDAVHFEIFVVALDVGEHGEEDARFPHVEFVPRLDQLVGLFDYDNALIFPGVFGHNYTRFGMLARITAANVLVWRNM